MFKYLTLTTLVAAPFFSGAAFAQDAAEQDKTIKIYMGAAIACSKVVQEGDYADGTETDCIEVKRLLDGIINSGEPMSTREKNYAVLSDMLVHQTIGTTYAKIDGLGSARGCQIVREARTIGTNYVNGVTIEADPTMGKVVTGIDALGENC